MNILFEKRLHDTFLWLNNRLGNSIHANRIPVSSEIELVQKFDLPKSEKIANTLEKKLYSFAPEFSTVHYPEACLYRFKNVQLAGDKAYPFKNGHLIGYCDDVRQTDSRKIRRPIRLFERKIQEPIFHLTGNNYENRGHFMIQHAARLFIAREWLLSNPQIKILTAFGHSKWQSKYAKMFGIEPERFIETGKGTLTCSDVYYVPMFYGSNYLPPKKVIEGMTSLYLQKSKSASSKIIFLSRNDAPDRRLLNEDELVDVMTEKLGEITVVYLKEHSLEEQIQIFSNASLIVGPYGQSFSNLMFCRNKQVLVLCPRQPEKIQHWTESFRDLGLQLGSQAARLIAETDYLENRNWIFPKERFETELCRYLALVNDAEK